MPTAQSSADCRRRRECSGHVNGSIIVRIIHVYNDIQTSARPRDRNVPRGKSARDARLRDGGKSQAPAETLRRAALVNAAIVFPRCRRRPITHDDCTGTWIGRIVRRRTRETADVYTTQMLVAYKSLK